jgi:hypothetical protein
MSDRKLVISDFDTGSRGGVWGVSPVRQWLDLFMDGESGTWRLFLKETTDQPTVKRLWGSHTMIESEHTERVDFSLDGLRRFHAELGRVLRDIEADPNAFNAEIRKAWAKG